MAASPSAEVAWVAWVVASAAAAVALAGQSHIAAVGQIRSHLSAEAGSHSCQLLEVGSRSYRSAGAAKVAEDLFAEAA